MLQSGFVYFNKACDKSSPFHNVFIYVMFSHVDGKIWHLNFELICIKLKYLKNTNGSYLHF